MNKLYEIIKPFCCICIYESFKKMSVSLSSTILFYVRKDKNSNENMLKPMETKTTLIKKRESVSNLSEMVDKKYLFSIDNKLPFIKKKSSKIELNNKIEYIEKNMCTQCTKCGKLIQNDDIYMLLDNFYCSELCRRRSVITYK